jgi:hypothetical protein
MPKSKKEELHHKIARLPRKHRTDASATPAGHGDLHPAHEYLALESKRAKLSFADWVASEASSDTGDATE